MKKIISITLAVTTVIWLSGVAMIAPVSAITIVEGDIVSPDAEYTDADGNAYYPYDVFIIKYVGAKKFKRLVLNPQVFDSYGHLEWANIKTATVAELQAFTTSELTRADGDDKVYKLFPDGDTGSKRWVETLDCFTTNSYDWDSVYTINTTDRDNYTTGAGMCGGGGEGDLNVSLASDTPASATIPKSATSVEFLKVNFTAGSEGAVTITNLALHRGGLGSSDDFDDLYLYENTTRLTDGRSVSAASNTVTFSGLSISIPSGSTKAISLVADMGTTATTPTNYFELVSASGITSDAVSVGGTFPIKGNTMTLSNAATVGEITIAALSDPANPKVGARGATVAKFSLNAASEDMTLNELRLIVKGTVDNDDLTNLVLKRGTEELATDAALSSKGYMEFVLATPYAFEDGDTKNFSVTADVSGEDGDSVEIYLDENTDLVAIGTDYGYGCGVDKGDYDGSEADDESDVDLEAGQITIAFNGPVATNVGLDTNDTVLMDFSITAQMFVTVKEMVVDIDGTDLYTSATYDKAIQDLKIKDKDTGVTIQGPEELDGTDDDDQPITFTEDYDIQAGETLNLQITGDIQDDNSVADNDWFRATIDVSGLDIEDANRDSVTDIVPNSDIEGNALTVEEAALSVTLSAIPTSKTYVTGQAGIETVGFIFTATEASDIEVTDLTVTGYIADLAASVSDMFIGVNASSSVYLKDIVSAVYIYDGTDLIDGPEIVEDDGDVIFDGFSWTISAGESKTVLVKTDISTTAPYDSSSDYFAFDIDDVSADITCYNDDGDAVSVSLTDHVNDGLNSDTLADPTIYQAVAAAGSMTIEASADQPEAGIVIAGDTGVVFNKLDFTATDEAFVVEKVQIYLDDTTDVADILQITLSYPTKTGSRDQNANIEHSTASASFDGMTFYVPKDDTAVLTIKADINGILDGATSGHQFSIDFRENGFKAMGQASSEELEYDDTGIDEVTGNTMTLYRTAPTFAKIPISGHTGALIPTTQTVAQFSITADENHELNFTSASGSLKFDVIASGGNTNETDLYLYDWNDDIVASNVDQDLNSGTTDLAFIFEEQDVVIPAGQTKPFYIKANLQYFDDDGDYFQMRLEDDDAADIEFVDDDRAAHDVKRQGPADQIPGLDIDFETFIRDI